MENPHTLGNSAMGAQGYFPPKQVITNTHTTVLGGALRNIPAIETMDSTCRSRLFSQHLVNQTLSKPSALFSVVEGGMPIAYSLCNWATLETVSPCPKTSTPEFVCLHWVWARKGFSALVHCPADPEGT